MGTSIQQVLANARASGDWNLLTELVPFARFQGIRVQADGDQFSCLLPYDLKLIGNPTLPALHGGAVGGFLECTAMFYLLTHLDCTEMPKTINFTFEFLRSGRAQDTFAHVFMVKQGQRVVRLRIEAWQTNPDEPITVGYGSFMVSAPPAPEKTDE